MIIAKVASDWNKPNGLKVVAPDDVADFVEQLPVKKIHGVGKKTAERLIIELRDKLGQAAKQDLFSTPEVLKQVKADPRQEAESALIALGYKPQEAAKAIALIPMSNSSSEDVIKAALKNMLRKGS